MNRILLTACVITVLVLSAGTAGASLIGDVVLGTLEISGAPGSNLFSGGAGPLPAIVGAGIEFTSVGTGSPATADLDASSLWLEIGPFPGPIGGDLTWWFEDLNWVDEPDGFIVDVELAGTNVLGITWAFGPDSIHVFFPNQDLRDGLFAHFDIIIVCWRGV